jgi:hypothetical protein
MGIDVLDVHVASVIRVSTFGTRRQQSSRSKYCECILHSIKHIHVIYEGISGVLYVYAIFIQCANSVTVGSNLYV